jgi:hypothetical protein
MNGSVTFVVRAYRPIFNSSRYIFSGFTGVLAPLGSGGGGGFDVQAESSNVNMTSVIRDIDNLE